jgi:hypothetical protein
MEHRTGLLSVVRELLANLREWLADMREDFFPTGKPRKRR